jgi:CheY-like chemotaxis protein
LVVDDDRAVLDMLVDLLRGAGYEAATCRDGKQVLVALDAEPYDLVLLDVLIPKLNGFNLIEQLRASPAWRELPVIMMSGIYKSRNHRAQMTTRFGVIDYLDKPLVPAALLELLSRTIGPGDPALAASGERPSEPMAVGALMDEKPVTLVVKKTDLPPMPPPAPMPPEPPAATTVRRAPTPPADAFDERLVDAGARAEQAAVESAAQGELAASASMVQGTVRERPLAAMLGRLWRERATGALLMRRDDVKKILYLRHGAVCHVRSNLVSECLGQVLLRERLIAPAELADSVERMRQGRRKQGEILVEMGALTSKNLEFALELQRETKLYEMFAWDEGEFRFKAGAATPAGAEFDAGTPALVIEGLRRSFDERRLRHRLAPIFDAPLSLRPSDVAVTSFGLSARELSVVRGLSLPASARELAGRMALGITENLRLIYALVVLELLVVES